MSVSTNDEPELGEQLQRYYAKAAQRVEKFRQEKKEWQRRELELTAEVARLKRTVELQQERLNSQSDISESQRARIVLEEGRAAALASKQQEELQRWSLELLEASRRLDDDRRAFELQREARAVDSDREGAISQAMVQWTIMASIMYRDMVEEMQRLSSAEVALATSRLVREWESVGTSRKALRHEVADFTNQRDAFESRVRSVKAAALRLTANTATPGVSDTPSPPARLTGRSPVPAAPPQLSDPDEHIKRLHSLTAYVPEKRASVESLEERLHSISEGISSSSSRFASVSVSPPTCRRPRAPSWTPESVRSQKSRSSSVEQDLRSWWVDAQRLTEDICAQLEASP